MNDRLRLSDLHVGQIGIVKAILATGTMRRRLQDLGVIEGTGIQCLQKSPAGDPVAYRIRGAAIALRKEDSSDIEVAVAG